MFYLPSPEEFHPLQRFVGPLAGERYDDYRDMDVGDAVLWMSRMSDKKHRGKVVRVKLRPSCILAGGKTLKT
jgi:hypothetical protein